MIAPYECNRKALHEAILYYFRHRPKSGEDTIQFVVITDFYHFYFFRAKEFEIFFLQKSHYPKALSVLCGQKWQVF